jgi:hypothetical protein
MTEAGNTSNPFRIQDRDGRAADQAEAHVPRRWAEPALNEMLADPLVRQLMSRDRISEPAMRTLLDEARTRLDAGRAG